MTMMPRLLLIALLLARCAGATEPAPPATGAGSAPAPLADRLIPFGFSIKKLPPAQQVELCERLGYRGLCLTGTSPDTFAAFAALPQVRSGAFAIPCALWWAEVDKLPDPAWLDRVVEQAARLRTALWIVGAGRKTPENRAKAITLLTTVAKACRPRQVQLVLYPHQGSTFETTDEARALWQEMACPEVRLSIHLCHELKAGNGGRMAGIVAAHADLTALVSISGADADTNRRGGWDTGIMPLGRGTYDARPFVRALADSGYAGPVVLHTYGLTAPAEELYAEALAVWRGWLEAPAGGAQPPR